jgi:iron(III) transport system substrate-binding protein
MISNRILLRAALALSVGGALGANVARAQTLTLYTSQPDRDAAQTVAAFTKRNPGVKVEIFRSGTTEVMNKLTAEFAAGDPRPDLLLIADAVSMEVLKRGGRLLAHSGADVANYAAGAYDPDRTYFGTKLITTGIVYNTAAKTKPASWRDLAAPDVKGQLIIPSPLYSGAAAITVGTFARTDGLGWPFIESLKANQAIAVAGNGAVLKSVASGEKAYGVIVDFMALNAKQKGSPVEFVFPREGVTAVTEPVAILRTTKNEKAAKAFVDFLLSVEGQELAVSQGYLPAHAKVQPPVGFPDPGDVKLMAMDAAAILAALDEDKKRFAQLFGQ